MARGTKPVCFCGDRFLQRIMQVLTRTKDLLNGREIYG